MKHGCGEGGVKAAYVTGAPLDVPNDAPPSAYRSRFHVWYCPRCDKLFWRRDRR